MRTVVEVLAYLHNLRQHSIDRSRTEEDTFARGLAMGMEAGFDLAIEALADLRLLAGRVAR